MAHHQSALSSLLQELLADPSLAHEELFRRLLQAGLQDLIDAEATTKIGAGPYPRTEHRVTGRNGTRPKTLATPAGQLDLVIPKLGSAEGLVDVRGYAASVAVGFMMSSNSTGESFPSRR